MKTDSFEHPEVNKTMEIKINSPWIARQLLGLFSQRRESRVDQYWGTRLAADHVPELRFRVSDQHDLEKMQYVAAQAADKNATRVYLNKRAEVEYTLANMRDDFDNLPDADPEPFRPW